MSSTGIEITFGGDAGLLSFSLERRLIPNAEDRWDQDQIDTYVVAKAGNFQGQVRTNIGSHELVYLDQLLVDLHQHVGQEQTTQFRLHESTVELTIRTDRQGHILIEVDVADGSFPGVHLLFTIEADQSYLSGWRHQIQEALECFPSLIDN